MKIEYTTSDWKRESCYFTKTKVCIGHPLKLFSPNNEL